MKIARENFSEGNILIYTNGILLPQQPEEFWQALNDYKINLRITRYPVKLDWNKIISMAERYKIDIEEAYGGRGLLEEMSFFVNPIDLTGSLDYKKNFAACDASNSCITLENGKLYTCSTIPCIRHFNKFFNKNIPVTEKDYIDIYKAPDKNYIFKN